MALAAVVLAAGGGTRMRSERPKTLHEIAGVPMLQHVLASAGELSPDRTVVVVGNGWRQVKSFVSAFAPDAEIALQPKQTGTGDAVAAARESLAGFDGKVLVLYGDTPLVRSSTTRSLAAVLDDGTDVAVVGFRAQDPSGYGRLITDAGGNLERIVEDRDATAKERLVDLCNSGLVAADSATLFSLLEGIGRENSAGEAYLTDIVAAARGKGLRCRAIEGSEEELLGVNSRADLARAEQAYQVRARAAALNGGATLVAPETVFFGFGSALGVDAVVEPHVVIGTNVKVGDRAVVRSFSHLEDCRIGEGATVGPFARIRPGTELGEGAKVGNFVEINASAIGSHSKISHLSYVGDSEVGDKTNIGAGTITCNYDGVSKHRTKVGNEAFIGSNSTLIAPVEVSDGAMTAAGSVITRNVPPQAIAIARERQTNVDGGADRLFRRLRDSADRDRVQGTGRPPRIPDAS